MKDKKVPRSIEGKLNEMSKKYRNNRFSSSSLGIQEKNGNTQRINFYGDVPEYLLGKKVSYKEFRKENSSELCQIIEHKKRSRKYTIESCVSCGIVD